MYQTHLLQVINVLKSVVCDQSIGTKIRQLAADKLAEAIKSLHVESENKEESPLPGQLTTIEN